ncbi:hypothetical protein L596_006237 [Steinernema carpocapsae]|uniref:Uncharacterized protein n=1 Tax=Steinernema carpocapsae TaxID=34508 RepID=A0A4U8V1G7_STECR|nr:hypothetical protein L596_006237 [Steinernema carpocapsae]
MQPGSAILFLSTPIHSFLSCSSSSFRFRLFIASRAIISCWKVGMSLSPAGCNYKNLSCCILIGFASVFLPSRTALSCCWNARKFEFCSVGKEAIFRHSSFMTP